MVAVFAISFGILWQRRLHDDAAVTVPLEAVATASTVPTFREQAALPPRNAAAAGLRKEVAPMQPQQAALQPQPAVGGGESRADALQPLPVAINIWNRETRHKIEGSVQNLSQSPLTVSAQVKNSTGDLVSDFQLVIDPGDTKAFSTDSGLLIRSQDQITFQSAPYQDRTQLVP